MTSKPRRNISEFTAGEPLDQVFMISQPILRTTTRGDYYIAAYLSDRTGRINARMWQASESIFNTLPHEGFVWVRGRTELYQSALQIVVDSIRPVEVDADELMDFMPTTEHDVDDMFARLQNALAQVKNPHLSNLLKTFLDDQELMRLFRIAPAAISLHHAYIGGLLEHTLSVLELALRVLPHYPDLDADLVLTGLFLHDIGKTTELDYDISFKYSDQGRLLGHLVKGVMLVEEKIKQLNDSSTEPFPRTLADCLEHIIISHHGTLEFGCPVLPALPEAFTVHFLDNLDSKVAWTISEIQKDSNKTNWTGYIKALETPLFKGLIKNPTK